MVLGIDILRWTPPTHTLKTNLDIHPVYHKSDNGIKAHFNPGVLAYWIVCVTKYRLKLKDSPNVSWGEMMHIARTLVVLTAEMAQRTVEGCQCGRVRRLKKNWSEYISFWR